MKFPNEGYEKQDTRNECGRKRNTRPRLLQIVHK